MLLQSLLLPTLFPPHGIQAFKQETPRGSLAIVSFQVLTISQVAEVVDFKTRSQNVSSRLLPALLHFLSFPEKFWLEPDANRPEFLLSDPSSIQTSKPGASMGLLL